MSFNPHAIERMQELAPDIPRGLTTCGFPEKDWSALSPERRAELATIPDYARLGATFVSHQHTDLDRARIAELKQAGAAILCWTIRSPEQAAAALRVADAITFEGYLP